MGDEIAATSKTNPQQKASEERRSNPASSILLAAQTFLADAEALQEVLDVAKPALSVKAKERRAELAQFLEPYREGKEDGERETTIRLDFMQVNTMVGLAAKHARGGFLFRGHLLVALVSRFDSFVAQVARELLLAFPARLSKRSIRYDDAVQFGSIDELRKRVIEDEIDEQMRGSHNDQLVFLSSLANVKLGMDEPELFAKFIELTERRNCHIHNDGRVSPQYRRVCAEHKVEIDKAIQNGDRLNVKADYFASSRQILSEMAFKISQTIIRKNFPTSLELADEHANAVGLQLLSDHRWNEALTVFEYSAGLRDALTCDESVRRNNALNKAQALVGLGRSDEALKIVSAMDWSASHPKYLLAIHLLKDEFAPAAALMASAGIDEDQYRTWPIFERFRQTSEFKDEFSRHFGHGFDQTVLTAVRETIAEIDGSRTESTSSDMEKIMEDRSEFESNPEFDAEGVPQRSQ